MNLVCASRTLGVEQPFPAWARRRPDLVHRCLELRGVEQPLPGYAGSMGVTAGIGVEQPEDGWLWSVRLVLGGVRVGDPRIERGGVEQPFPGRDGAFTHPFAI